MAFWGPFLGGVAGGLITGLFNNDSVNDTNEANRELWREQADYNQPINQVRRLEAAGLNPQLAYGQVAESKMSSPPTMVAPRPGDAISQGISNYQQVVNMQRENALARQQIEQAKAQTDLAKQNANYAQYENKVLQGRGMLKSDPNTVKLITSGAEAVANYGVGVLKRGQDMAKDALNVGRTTIDRAGSYIKSRASELHNRKGVPLKDKR